MNEHKTSTELIKQRIDQLKTGTYYWFGYGIENQKKFELIKNAGFDSVMLWWGDELAIYDQDKFLLLEMARAAGLEVENIHAPYEYTDLIWTNGLDSESMAERYFQYIIDCAEHSIPTVVVHITDHECPIVPTGIGLDRYKRLVDIAEQKGVNLALENVKNPEFLQFLFSNIQSKRLGFCYDSGHESCYARELDFLDLYGDKLMALHLHDNDGRTDQHRIPGDGSIDWNKKVEKIKATSYVGSISLEVINDFSGQYSDMSAQNYLRTANDRIKNLFL